MRAVKLAISILICQLAGYAGSIFTKTSVDTWYRAIEKPFFTPPSWLFAPVWIFLYFMMGVSLFLVWDNGLENPQAKKAVSVFLLQLMINSSWSAVFFGMRDLALSVMTILLLWLAIIWTLAIFLRISKTAAFLLIPYLFWVSFAAVLNVSIFLLNP